jgi:hypothetical protein
MSPAAVNKILWIKKHWNLKENPFPSEAIARLGGDDLRENGLLFDPHVQQDKVDEAAEKFVLGAAYGGLKFGFLWSLGTGIHGDARGFGKSSLMQYLVEDINKDWGRETFLRTGLDESDADEHPMCAVLASFDMANARSLNAVFFTATQYACKFRVDDDTPTLAERIHTRLVKQVGSEDPADLRRAIEAVQERLRGRTLGPPVAPFLELRCEGDSSRISRHLENEVSDAKRTRSGASYLATFLLMVKAAGIMNVLLCCDQLEDFASTSTTKQKRTLEVERFRDYLLEIQPMSDMLSVVVTMHPRATQAIGDMWRLADCPAMTTTGKRTGTAWSCWSGSPRPRRRTSWSSGTWSATAPVTLLPIPSTRSPPMRLRRSAPGRTASPATSSAGPTLSSSAGARRTGT